MKRTVICKLCPEARIKGRANPERENSELFICFDAIATEPFEAERVMCFMEELPTTVFGKESVDGVKVNCPTALGWTAAIDWSFETKYGAALLLFVGESCPANGMLDKQTNTAIRAWGEVRMCKFCVGKNPLDNSQTCRLKISSADLLSKQDQT